MKKFFLIGFLILGFSLKTYGVFAESDVERRSSNAPPAGASSASSFVTISSEAGLSAERTLTGTASQITVTDAGANSTVTLSTPQNIATTSNVQFGKVGINATPHATAKLYITQDTVNAAAAIFRNNDTTGGASAPIFIVNNSGGDTSNVSIEDLDGALVLRTSANTETGFGTNRFQIGEEGGFTIPSFDVVSSQASDTGIVFSDTLAAGTKLAKIGGRHATNNEENVLGVAINSQAGLNSLELGGGFGTHNAITQGRAYASASATGTGGTEIFSWDVQAFKVPSGIEFKGRGKVVYEPSSAQGITGVAATFTADATMIILDPDGNYTLTSTPTISGGKTGQIVYLTAANTEVNTVTVQDQGALSGSNLSLGASTRAIASTDVLTLLYDGSNWVEVSYANN